MDRDFDGKLSFEEFMGEETSLERLFKSMDIDGDGSVTKEVWTRAGKYYYALFMEKELLCDYESSIIATVCFQVLYELVINH